MINYRKADRKQGPKSFLHLCMVIKHRRGGSIVDCPAMLQYPQPMLACTCPEPEIISYWQAFYSCFKRDAFIIVNSNPVTIPEAGDLRCFYLDLCKYARACILSLELSKLPLTCKHPHGVVNASFQHCIEL